MWLDTALCQAPYLKPPKHLEGIDGKEETQLDATITVY
jgi:hypothetical protein